MHLLSLIILGLQVASKILEHFGFESSRQTAAKFKPCKGIEKDEHKDVKATVCAAYPSRGVRAKSESVRNRRQYKPVPEKRLE